VTHPPCHIHTIAIDDDGDTGRNEIEIVSEREESERRRRRREEEAHTLPTVHQLLSCVHYRQECRG
jgi:hypothetical protein